jgi:hypothetical protein
VPVASNRREYGRLLALRGAGQSFLPEERELFEVYARYTRAGDTVARLGGDEFAVLIDPSTAPGDAEDVSDRIVHALTSPSASTGTASSSAPASAARYSRSTPATPTACSGPPTPRCSPSSAGRETAP